MSAQYTVAEFVNVVSEMRKCQRYFFATRDKNAIPKSKGLENQVDVILDNAKSFGFKEGVK